jgi:hypothetical protein
VDAIIIFLSFSLLKLCSMRLSIQIFNRSRYFDSLSLASCIFKYRNLSKHILFNVLNLFIFPADKPAASLPPPCFTSRRIAAVQPSTSSSSSSPQKESSESSAPGAAAKGMFNNSFFSSGK